MNSSEYCVVLQSPSLPYKRKIFFKFVEVFQDMYYLQELKAKILQHIILPLFAYSFEEGKVDEVSICITVIIGQVLSSKFLDLFKNLITNTGSFMGHHI